MSGWRIVPNPAHTGKPHLMHPVCHDGTPEVTIQCDCGNLMHYHESLIRNAPVGSGVAGRCHACGDVLTFEPELFAIAFAAMRFDGWIKRYSSTPERPVCPGCGRVSFLLCKGGCYKSHVHNARCLYCKYKWKLRAGPRAATCRDCGATGSETLDDSNPGMCPDCHRKHLQELVDKLPGMVETYEDDPTIVAAWAREFLIEEAGMPPDWADIMSASMLAGENYLSR